MNIKHIAGLLLLTGAAFLIQGYHPYAEDSEIYLPGVLKILDPSLFQANAEFFGEHAGHTLYPNLIASSVRAAHLPLPWAALLWHLLSIFLLLAASWRLASVLFESQSLGDESARWAAVALMAALLTLPIAGTFLSIMDQYLNPRNLTSFAVLFALAEVLHRKYTRAMLWLAFAAAMHPFMASFGILFCFALGSSCSTGFVRGSWDLRPRFHSGSHSRLRQPLITRSRYGSVRTSFCAGSGTSGWE